MHIFIFSESDLYNFHQMTSLFTSRLNLVLVTGLFIVNFLLFITFIFIIYYIVNFIKRIQEKIDGMYSLDNKLYKQSHNTSLCSEHPLFFTYFCTKYKHILSTNNALFTLHPCNHKHTSMPPPIPSSHTHTYHTM